MVGGPTIIIKLMQLGLIDEYQFYVQPIILGQGLPLFKNITDRIDLKLSNYLFTPATGSPQGSVNENILNEKILLPAQLS